MNYNAALEEYRQENEELKAYLQIVEAELGRRRLSERSIAHLQKILRKNTPAFSLPPTARVGRIILKEIKETLHDR